MITKTTVIKPKGKIFFTSWRHVLQITRIFQNLNVITVGDEYSGIYDTIPCKRRLIINHVVIPSNLKPTDFKRIEEFVKSLNGESVLVHCELGSKRSPFVVNYILNKFPEYQHDVFLKIPEL